MIHPAPATWVTPRVGRFTVRVLLGGGPVRIACVIGLACLAGCHSPARDPGPSPEGRAVTVDAPEITASKIGQAEKLAERGDYESALETLRVALARASRADHRTRIQDLRLDLKRSALAQILRAWISVAEDHVLVGQALRVTLHMENRGRVPVTIPRIDYRRRLLVFRKEMGRTAIAFRLQLDEYDARGTHREERFDHFVEPDDDIQVKPGETWSMTTVLYPDQIQRQTAFTRRLSATCLKRLEIGAVLRPVQLQVADRDFYTHVVFDPIVIYLLPRGAEAMFEAPLKHLRFALIRASREPQFLPHVLVAASLLRGADREAGHEELLRVRESRNLVLGPSVERALELFWPPEAPVVPGPSGRPKVTFRDE